MNNAGFVDVADVIVNNSKANIPLETMRTDNYMYKRRFFTLVPDYFPTSRMREIVDYLHAHDQQYVMMIDPAVAYLPDEPDSAYARGSDKGVWFLYPNDSYYEGLVWPGVTVWPDWFNPDASLFWTAEDMITEAKREQQPINHYGEDLNTPPYQINNAAGVLSSETADTDVTHYNGLLEYDTHQSFSFDILLVCCLTSVIHVDNLYGTMMPAATCEAMLARRPWLRTLVITRSTFAGAGARVGKWLGDNFSAWYPWSGVTSAGTNLCARWAMLGAFIPFMRNHNADTSISQELYRWPTVAQAARNALNIRYRPLDYLYTALHQASVDGTPVASPLWFAYPSDANTFGIDLQHWREGYTRLQATDFELVVAPGRDGRATGPLYVDDGVQDKATQVGLTFSNNVLSVKGSFGYLLGVNARRVRVLGVEKKPVGAKLRVRGKSKDVKVT
ncbi:glycoside hydrolase [Punctularia strigosozonata HHB-11173 SS5]|uniref:Glycoside hydrolase n=1 Tax=Punctularia strigosozonata (strain HHB-11173) TaxID=741275 RepID=R7S2J0_PUNST|nr:glycoside hydrolase [Punctularia strigosozonata HHB-11173 SS5]EIN04610.1 glycoside hydrolase [Punctularia strigosozonata HHB-11173 SS5]